MTESVEERAVTRGDGRVRVWRLLGELTTIEEVGGGGAPWPRTWLEGVACRRRRRRGRQRMERSSGGRHNQTGGAEECEVTRRKNSDPIF
jgi:hypothetical protein